MSLSISFPFYFSHYCFLFTLSTTAAALVVLWRFSDYGWKKGVKYLYTLLPTCHRRRSIICIDRDPSIFVPKWPHRYHSVLKGCYLHKAVIINTMVKVWQAFTMLFIFTIVIPIEHTVNSKWVVNMLRDLCHEINSMYSCTVYKYTMHKMLLCTVNMYLLIVQRLNNISV